MPLKAHQSKVNAPVDALDSTDIDMHATLYSGRDDLADAIMQKLQYLEGDSNALGAQSLRSLPFDGIAEN